MYAIAHTSVTPLFFGTFEYSRVRNEGPLWTIAAQTAVVLRPISMYRASDRYERDAFLSFALIDKSGLYEVFCHDG